MPFTDSIKMVDVIIANKTTLNATPSDVLFGKEFIGANQDVEVGSIPVNSERSDITIAGGESYNIPSGYNPSSYVVKAKDVSEETPASAIESDILNPKTAWVNGSKITGTMNNIGKETDLLACGATHTISRGFHDGSGVITAMSLKDQTYASIIKENIIEGATCWANGVKLTGTMPNNGTVSTTISAGESYTIPEGYHSGSGKVTAKTLASQTSGNATAGEIVNGYTAWVNGEKVTGTISYNAATTIVLPMNGTYEIPNGYHTGMGKVTQNVPSKAGQTIAPTKDSQTIEVAGYYMEGNIVVSGVNALNYQYDGVTMKDTSGNAIVEYDLTVEDNSATISFEADNWHDGSTVNIYNISFIDLVDATTGNVMNLNLNGYISKGTDSIVTAGNITVGLGFSDADECQYITVSGITGGKVNITSVLCAREY